MLIGLCGPTCAGKKMVAEYLTRELGFSYIKQTSNLHDPSGTADIEGKESRNLKSFSPSLSELSQCWRQDINVVIQNVKPFDPALPDLLKRPYFLLVYIDAPVLVRFKRAVESQRYSEQQLALFIEDDDGMKYNTLKHNTQCADGSHISTAETERQNGCKTVSAQTAGFTLSELERLSRLQIANWFRNPVDLYKALSEISFTEPELLRPSWDTYFMSLAKLAAERTNCMKRRVGCVIARNKRIVATGYNGTPSGVRNCSDGGCPRCNSAQSSQGTGLDLCLCLHAEENAIIEAGRERCERSTLYTNLFPCVLCSKKIVQSGISRVVFDKHYATDKASENLLRAGGVLVDNFVRDTVCAMLSRSAIAQLAA